MKRRALVTGGAGFIGSNLSWHLLRSGWDVTVFDTLSRQGSENNLAWLKTNPKAKRLHVEVKDIRDYDSLKQGVKRVDVVFHLAAQVAVTISVLHPREDFEINAAGSFNVLEAVREAGHKPMVIFASTNKVYGAMEKTKIKEYATRYAYADLVEGIDERYPLDFHSPYGCSNGAADQYTRDCFRIYGIPTLVFRQSCIYGPRQMGVEDQGWVAHFAICANRGKPITIYGDGKQVRDILYVDDLIEAYLKGVERISKVAGEIYNIGGGVRNALSLLEYIEFLESRTRKKLKIQYGTFRPGDQKIFISNNKKAEKELGWKPHTSYKEGMHHLLEWIKQEKTFSF